MSLHPSDGIRILLERVSDEEDAGVRYSAAIFTVDQRFDYQIAFDPAGRPALSAAASADPPRESEAGANGRAAAPLPGSRAFDLLSAIARTVGKHASSTSPPRWPHRVLRWRKG